MDAGCDQCGEHFLGVRRVECVDAQMKQRAAGAGRPEAIMIDLDDVGALRRNNHRDLCQAAGHIVEFNSNSVQAALIRKAA